MKKTSVLFVLITILISVGLTEADLYAETSSLNACAIDDIGCMLQSGDLTSFTGVPYPECGKHCLDRFFFCAKQCKHVALCENKCYVDYVGCDVFCGN